jgi:hypothetical protein
MSDEEKNLHHAAFKAFVVKLGCMSQPVAQRFALRTGVFLLPVHKDPFGSELARAFLSAEAEQKCHVLRDIRQDFREVLERAATAR